MREGGVSGRVYVGFCKVRKKVSGGGDKKGQGS